jgi:hypothetical protein
LKGTPASLPLPVTRRGEREPAKQPCQRLLDLAVDGGLRTLGLIRVRIHPVGRTPDANIDALLRSINAPAVLASPDDHGFRRRKQLIIAALSCGPETSQRRTRRLPNGLVPDPPLARAWLCARQLRDDSAEPLDANTTGRRGRRQFTNRDRHSSLSTQPGGKPRHSPSTFGLCSWSKLNSTPPRSTSSTCARSPPLLHRNCSGQARRFPRHARPESSVTLRQPTVSTPAARKVATAPLASGWTLLAVSHSPLCLLHNPWFR